MLEARRNDVNGCQEGTAGAGMASACAVDEAVEQMRSLQSEEAPEKIQRSRGRQRRCCLCWAEKDEPADGTAEVAGEAVATKVTSVVHAVLPKARTLEEARCGCWRVCARLSHRQYSWAHRRWYGRVTEGEEVQGATVPT